jgi:hypothetical protein
MRDSLRVLYVIKDIITYRNALMAITANDVETLRIYASGVMDRADDHADHVSAAALALLGGIIWKADPGSISIRQYDGAPANMLWIEVAGRRYAFLYRHGGKIEIHDRSQSGALLYSFDNQNSLVEIEAAIKAL